jgi:hypothetical protein
MVLPKLTECLTAILTTLALAGCGGGTGSSNSVVPLPSLAFITEPPTQASEGVNYSYAMETSVQGATFELVSGPAGATLSGNLVSWSPTSQQAHAVSQFKVTAADAGATASQSWSVTPGSTIRGSQVDTCISDTGVTITKANDLTGVPIKALFPNSPSGFDTYSGSGAHDGTFSITNVPAGPHWLILPETHLWTSSTSVDLGQRSWGGCRYEAPSHMGTSLAIEADGLNPWQYYDYFSFSVPNARTGDGALPALGATSLSLTVPYGNLLVMDAANGDNAYLSQLVTTVYDGIEFHALQNFAGPFPMTLQDGQPNTLSATLQQLPQSQTLRANIEGSAFVALYDGMYPGASEANPGYNLRLEVTPDTYAPTSNGIFLIETSHGFTTDTDAGDVAYANPYPAAWKTFLRYYDYASHPLSPPGATAPLPEGLMTQVITADLPTATNPIAPLVGPALDPQINGVSLFSDQTITGTSPTLSWRPPAVGTASGYSILVYSVVVQNGNVAPLVGTILYTSSTSIVMPPGIITSGNIYYIVIDSLYRKNVDIGVSPYLETFPEGETNLGSGLITVQ